MKGLKIQELLTLEETIGREIFDGLTYPWEALPRIHDFILELGASLPEEEYEQRGEDVWIARSARSMIPPIFTGRLLSAGTLR